MLVAHVAGEDNHGQIGKARMIGGAAHHGTAGQDLPLIFCGLSLVGLDGSATLRALRDEPLLRGTRQILLDRPDDLADGFEIRKAD